jgi:hypothetical protein
MRHTPSDVVSVSDRWLEPVNEITILARRGPREPLKIALAGAITQSAKATVRFVTVVKEDATSEQIRSVEEFHIEFDARCGGETSSDILTSDDLHAALVDATAGADVAVVSRDQHPLFHDLGHGDQSN